ncbi:MAG TPA: DUF2877 domain-containing protein, partial [Thermomicrobiales bacterium]|nr:DUF2877 domain-containing protein [Thermomicrobiales bacterium]
MTAPLLIAADRCAPGALEALAQLREPGHVVSRYRSAIDIETAPGRLLAVQAPGTPLSPFSLALAHGVVVAWPEPGAPARVRGSRLDIGPLSIDLRFARPAPAIEIPSPAADWDPSSVVRRLQPLGRYGAFGPIWKERGKHVPGISAAWAIQSLMAATRAADASADLSGPAFRLMGRGPGATPSGDDLLVGFVASWLAFRPDATAHVLARLLAREAPARTTRLAAEFYHHLALGRLTDRLA